jgi:uncharacterized protein YpbB
MEQRLKVVSGMSYFDGVILLCLKRLNGERTIYSIYHLLKGKKTSQTIQDAHLFDLTHYFGTYQTITRDGLETVIHHLLEHQWVEPYEEHRFRLTKIGDDHLEILQNQYTLPVYLNGLKYYQKDIQFWERLSLLVQVISNLVNKETNYIPVQKNRETHSWIKSFLNKTNLERNLLARTLYEELVDCLSLETLSDPSIFIFRLTGFKRIGLTSQQTAEMLKMEYEHYHLEFLNILHYLLDQITANKNRFPLIYSIIESSKKNMVMTNSSSKTYELLKLGYSIEEISKYRSLKNSTIEDHIVEIALNIPSFSIDPFVDQQKQKRILTAARQMDSKQLRLIKSEVPLANYFEIRLVLAKYGVK